LRIGRTLWKNKETIQQFPDQEEKTTEGRKLGDGHENEGIWRVLAWYFRDWKRKEDSRKGWIW